MANAEMPQDLSLTQTAISLLVSVVGTGLVGKLIFRAGRDSMRESFVSREEFETYKDTNAHDIERLAKPMEELARAMQELAVTQAAHGTDIAWIRRTMETNGHRS